MICCYSASAMHARGGGGPRGRHGGDRDRAAIAVTAPPYLNLPADRGAGGEQGPLRAAWSWLKQTIVCHERTDERRCDAVQEMRVGPSEPAVRSRLQTTASCDGQEPWW